MMTRVDDLERSLLEQLRKSQDPPTDLLLRVEGRIAEHLDASSPRSLPSQAISERVIEAPSRAVTISVLLAMGAAILLLL